MNSKTQNSSSLRKGKQNKTDVQNKIYICPCKRSYDSYMDLWVHIQNKHEGIPPGVLPKSFCRETGKRLEGKQNKTQTNFNYGNQIDHYIQNNEELILSKFLSILYQNKQCTTFSEELKTIYLNHPFYQIYIKFEPLSLNSQYNEVKDIFEENCLNVLCEFLCEINFRIKISAFRILALIFVIMLAQGIKEKQKGSISVLKEQSANKLGYYSSFTLKRIYEKTRKHELMIKLNCFNKQKVVRLMELFYMWVGVKKYSSLSVKINYDFFS